MAKYGTGPKAECHQQPAVARTGEVLEDVHNIIAERLVAAEQPEVCVHLGCQRAGEFIESNL